jgi:hypothetical protein
MSLLVLVSHGESRFEKQPKAQNRTYLTENAADICETN